MFTIHDSDSDNDIAAVRKLCTDLNDQVFFIDVIVDPRWPGHTNEECLVLMFRLELGQAEILASISDTGQGTDTNHAVGEDGR
ncbi:hypothetical protein HNP33_002719 [Comamonas odontotermitis]|uniref:Uncharacterized protein n=1 Tax=Comamonas odontotermitis TaxID=379895 RepID=A0ABR6RHJ1_9BURK|nr:hypothetical protein [Comamonas odontotermitis]MBB6578633.1 hypothetical protein [Comamonas odontotermitis]